MRVIELAGPAGDEFSGTARVVAVSVGSQAGLDVDGCDELCVAVEQACAALSLAGSPRLLVTFNIHGHVEVSVRSSRPQPFTIDQPSRLVMSTMTDSFHVDSDDGSIRLTKNLS